MAEGQLVTDAMLNMILRQFRSASGSRAGELSARYNLRHIYCGAMVQRLGENIPLPNPGVLLRSTAEHVLVQERLRSDGALAFTCNTCGHSTMVGIEQLEDLRDRGFLLNPPGPGEIGYEAWCEARDSR